MFRFSAIGYSDFLSLIDIITEVHVNQSGKGVHLDKSSIILLCRAAAWYILLFLGWETRIPCRNYFGEAQNNAFTGLIWQFIPYF